jgi:predicted MFS family arabinose efflux permease
LGARDSNALTFILLRRNEGDAKVFEAPFVGRVNRQAAPIVLSLNASFMFLGFSFGAALGSVTLTYAAPSALGWVGSLCVLASLLLSVRTMRATAATAEPANA